MKTNPFPFLGEPVSRLGFGAFALGGVFGAFDKNEAIDAMHQCWDHGDALINRLPLMPVHTDLAIPRSSIPHFAIRNPQFPQCCLTWRLFCYYASRNMAVNTQFSIATHIMASLGHASGEEINSTLIAGSVNTSPSFVRRVLAKLSRAGLVETATGKNGACWLARPTRAISLLEIYRAVEAPKAFAIHQYPVEKRCPVSRHIKSALGRVLDETQQALEQRLSRITLAQVIADFHQK